MLFSTVFGRRVFLRNLSAAAVTGCLRAVPAPVPQQELNPASPDPQLDRFIDDYMRAMNAPGLTLGLANKAGTVRVATFGYSDLEQKVPVSPDQLFEIGSITKSFVALALLQIHDQGKLDLQKPILDYLPWAPIEANYGVIKVHHLLTHSSGLPDALGVFLSDPEARHVQGFAPGEHFHYCNLGFALLGYLIEALENRPWVEVVHDRIFTPLRMSSSYALVTNETKSRRPLSYIPYDTDATYTRHGRLGRAPDLVFGDSAGSILSTPGDMARYLQMLLNRGAYPQGRIVSEDSFAMFSTAYIKAPPFGPTASYGYGIGVDKLDGHTILRHTGGMVSFASSIHVDLDGGVAAFASINAMQGYRPVPVTQFAVQLLNAREQNTASPAAPELPGNSIKDTHDYAGHYTSQSGKAIEVIADGDRLAIRSGSDYVLLQQEGGDIFIAETPGWDRFPIVFGRAEAAEPANKGPVVEVAYGADWYTNPSYSGPHSFPDPEQLRQYTGWYHADSAWIGGARIVLRKGKLWAEGVTPLQPIGDGLFRLGENPHIPDTAQFCHLANGKAQMLKINGADLWRLG